MIELQTFDNFRPRYKYPGIFKDISTILRYVENLIIFRKKIMIFRILLRKSTEIMFFLGSYFNANWAFQ